MRPFWCLGLVVLFSFFSNPAFTETEPVILHLPQHAYISNPNPALADVNCLYINIGLPRAYKNPDSLPAVQIKQQIEQQVRTEFLKCDINVIDTAVDENSPVMKILKRRIDSSNVAGLIWRPYNIPEFRISIDLLRIADTNQCVFWLQSSLLKNAQLKNGPEAFMMADVWQNETVMRMVPANDLAEALVAASVNDAKWFIGSWSAATKLKKQIDVNQLGPLGPRLKKATADRGKNSSKQQDTETKYVASKNSKVFHKADCPSAKRILPKNLVTYATREDAVKAGKRPCQRCNP
jgi:hypothetical protein